MGAIVWKRTEGSVAPQQTDQQPLHRAPNSSATVPGNTAQPAKKLDTPAAGQPAGTHSTLAPSRPGQPSHTSHTSGSCLRGKPPGQPSTSVNGCPRPQPPQKRQRLPVPDPNGSCAKASSQSTDVASKLREQQLEMERLRRQMQEKEALLAKEQAAQAAKDAVRAQHHQQQVQAARRKEQLSKGFAALSASAAMTPSAQAEGAGRRAVAPPAPASLAPAVVADEFEVARVMHSSSDLECLQLAPGSGLAVIRRSYRRLAVALHPDKCKLEGSAAAFQRLHKAYTNLTKAMTG